MDIDPRLNKIDDCLYRVSVKAVITNKENRLLICHEEEGWWNLPGGGIDYAETDVQALMRELKEEISLTAETIINFDKTPAFITFGLGSKAVPKIYLYYKVQVKEQTLAPSQEISEIRWINPEELLNLPLSPSLGNPQTLVDNLKNSN